jgi:hypothetical protein
MESGLDRITARALVDAGYMPIGEYIRLFGDEVMAEAYHHSPNTAPDLPALMHESPHPQHRSIVAQLLELFHH